MNRLLLENNYIIIPNFINPHKANSLEEEYRKYCSDNNIEGDPQAPESHSSYNYISFLELLCEKTQEVSSILEETVLPTYVYSRVYHRDSVLERHRDRDACEISLTLHLGSDKPWEIYIESPKGEERCVNLRPGDAMLYLGKVADHWRNEFSGEYYTQVFLHYVRSRGDCSYTYFDKCKNEEESKLGGIGDIKENKKDIEIKENNLVLTPKPSNTLEQYIHVFDNILSEELCDMIFEEYVNSDEWVDTLVGSERSLNKNVRNCRQLLLSDSEVIKNNHDKRLKIDKMIHESVNKVIQEYIKIHKHFSIDIDTGYTLLKYEEGEFYIEHTDSFKQQQRSLSCSLQLNEDYMGGEFAFFGREMTIKSKKGSAIVFPSNFMYPHEVMPVTQGTRYSIITWLV
jgi:predicted 2-oxoglutarate/Fe(II)-dependent dioxygenase YbiX